jgi:hypothetical protein
MNNVTFQYWLMKLKESWLAISILSVFFGAVIIYLAVVDYKPVKSESVIGQLVNFHQVQSITGSTKSIFIVKLNNNSEVRVEPPPHTPIKINHNIELELRETESGRVTYEFVKYHGSS